MMAKVDFFDTAYLTEVARSDAEFGIYDPGNNLPALTTVNPQHYQAKVLNPLCRSLQFVPIDHNMNILRENGDLENTCDGMMYCSKDYLLFIELKDKVESWVSDAVSQLEITINIFKLNHKSNEFKRRYAYAANVKRPSFHHSFKQVMQRFYAENKFILRFGTTINVSY